MASTLFSSTNTAVLNGSGVRGSSARPQRSNCSFSRSVSSRVPARISLAHARKAEKPALSKSLVRNVTVAAASSPLEVYTPEQIAAKKEKKCVVITGASSGLGLNTAKACADKGWHVIMGVRDFTRAEVGVKELGMTKDQYTMMYLDLASRDSVKSFVANIKDSGYKVDTLMCNAAIYMPLQKEILRNSDGYELTVATNHLGHFLLANLMMEELVKAESPKLIIVGSVTHNPNELGGKIPPQADLGNLEGLKRGFRGEDNVMINGGEYEPVKAYKDSKAANILTVKELHRRFNQKTGITFASLYPGCIADTPLFRNHYGFFQTLFPVFQKYITKQYVSQEEAGRRASEVVTNTAYNESGAYWSWKNQDSSKYLNRVSDQVSDEIKSRDLYDYSLKLVGIDEPFLAETEPVSNGRASLV